MKSKITIILLAVLVLIGGACSKNESSPSSEGAASNKGIGPITSITLEAIDPAKASAGEQLFKTKCSACHKLAEKYVGPAMSGVTKRRSPEWIMNMILNPVEMTQKDPVAQELLATHYTQMTFQNVTQDEARQILEFFRKNDQ